MYEVLGTIWEEVAASPRGNLAAFVELAWLGGGERAEMESSGSYRL